MYFFRPHSVIAFFCISTRPIPLSPIVPLPFHTPEYICPLTFYDSYLPQTPQSLCTNLSKLNCSIFLFLLSKLVGSYCATKKTLFFPPHFYWAASIYWHIIHNRIWDPFLSFTNSVSYYLMTLIFRDIYGVWDGTVITSRETEQNASTFEDEAQNALFKDPVLPRCKHFSSGL